MEATTEQLARIILLADPETKAVWEGLTKEEQKRYLTISEYVLQRFKVTMKYAVDIQELKPGDVNAQLDY